MLKRSVILKRPGRSLRMMKRQYVFVCLFYFLFHLLAVFTRYSAFTLHFRRSSGQDMLVRMFLITDYYQYHLIYEHVHLRLTDRYFTTYVFM